MLTTDHRVLSAVFLKFWLHISEACIPSLFKEGFGEVAVSFFQSRSHHTHQDGHEAELQRCWQWKLDSVEWVGIYTYELSRAAATNALERRALYLRERFGTRRKAGVIIRKLKHVVKSRRKEIWLTYLLTPWWRWSRFHSEKNLSLTVRPAWIVVTDWEIWNSRSRGPMWKIRTRCWESFIVLRIH